MILKDLKVSYFQYNQRRPKFWKQKLNLRSNKINQIPPDVATKTF